MGSRDALARFRAFRNVFAYPYGDPAAVDAAAVRAVRAAGFAAAFTTGEASLTGAEEPLALDRVRVDERTLDDFR
jgi:hypothetical protein